MQTSIRLLPKSWIANLTPKIRILLFDSHTELLHTAPSMSRNENFHPMITEKTFYIEAETGPICMKVMNGEQAYTLNDKADLSALNNLFQNQILFYVSGFLGKNRFLRNIHRHAELHKDLAALLTQKHTIMNGIAFCGNEHFERGYFIAFDSSRRTEATKQIRDLVSRSGVMGDSPVLSLYNGIEEKTVRAQTLFEDKSSEFYVFASPFPAVHPAFVRNSTNSVYHDIQRCYETLAAFESFDEIKELIKICDAYIKKSEDWESKLPLKAKNPVIVIEGLDATGKTTLTKNLAKSLNATVFKSPPECICHLRSKFDSHPQLLRRAFYTLGNYAIAAMIQQAAEDGVVIVDRFWNSTAAYAIATDVGTGIASSLPPKGHWVYSWPSDLLRPDAVFLLTIKDEERRKRLLGRGTVKTDEELRLESSSPFRVRLEESYNRMENPALCKIDASGSPDSVLNETLELLKARNFI